MLRFQKLLCLDEYEDKIWTTWNQSLVEKTLTLRLGLLFKMKVMYSLLNSTIIYRIQTLLNVC